MKIFQIMFVLILTAGLVSAGIQIIGEDPAEGVINILSSASTPFGDTNSSTACFGINGGVSVLLGNSSCNDFPGTGTGGAGGGEISNQSLNKIYLNLSGTNANQNINVGVYNITAGFFKGLFDWVIAPVSRQFLSFNNSALSLNTTAFCLSNGTGCIVSSGGEISNVSLHKEYYNKTDINLNDTAYVSTYNATYQIWAYNQSFTGSSGGGEISNASLHREYYNKSDFVNISSNDPRGINFEAKNFSFDTNGEINVTNASIRINLGRIFFRKPTQLTKPPLTVSLEGQNSSAIIGIDMGMNQVADFIIGGEQNGFFFAKASPISAIIARFAFLDTFKASFSHNATPNDDVYMNSPSNDNLDVAAPNTIKIISASLNVTSQTSYIEENITAFAGLQVPLPANGFCSMVFTVVGRPNDGAFFCRDNAGGTLLYERLKGLADGIAVTYHERGTGTASPGYATHMNGTVKFEVTPYTADPSVVTSNFTNITMMYNKTTVINLNAEKYRYEINNGTALYGGITYVLSYQDADTLQCKRAYFAGGILYRNETFNCVL